MTDAVIKTDKHVPVEPAFWVLIFGDLIAFSIMFIAFMVRRFESVATYEVFLQGSQALNQFIGICNTLILLTSSFFIARALILYRLGHPGSSRKSIVYGVMCGLAFITLKLYEYFEKINQNITVTSDRFFEFYFTFTGVHLMHVIIGVILLVIITRKIDHQTKENTFNYSFLEGVACYWHMVDLLWIMLFALFYLLF